MARSPSYLHPFVCSSVGDRSSVRLSNGTRQHVRCSRAVRLSRKFKPARRGDIAQWAKVEALVKLGFRFETIYDADGAIIPYPSSERGIPAFVTKDSQVARQSTDKAAHSNAALALRRRQRQAARTRQTRQGRAQNHNDRADGARLARIGRKR